MMYIVFFFKAEDGIRDYKVTGVQTCALPIWQNFAAGNDVAFEISHRRGLRAAHRHSAAFWVNQPDGARARLKVNLHFVDRKSTRLNSSHLVISYAVFCLKKKN